MIIRLDILAFVLSFYSIRNERTKTKKIILYKAIMNITIPLKPKDTNRKIRTTFFIYIYTTNHGSNFEILRM